MRIRILGGGWYGCHIASELLRSGHEVALHESSARLFAGASGANPGRLHLGFHYPRSGLTRKASQSHYQAFMRQYGHMTRAVHNNVYAVAAQDSQVDFSTYLQVLDGEVRFLDINPAEFGLQNVEGAVMTGERYVMITEVRRYFEASLKDVVTYAAPPGQVDDREWDWTVDCTFCANDEEAIDRFEPCVVGVLAGPTDRAVTIMDGPFPSIYPWDDKRGWLTITSARDTPLSKSCKTYAEAQKVLTRASAEELNAVVERMRAHMAHFWPASRETYRPVTFKTAIRAMPRSAADARLVDVVRVGDRAVRVRAGKIDAIFDGARMVREIIGA